VERDVSLLRDLGVQLHFRADGSATVNELKGRGFRYVVVSIGAEVDRDAGVPGALPALSFLRQFRREAAGLALGGSVAVVGAGDTAMDAARAARRVPGVQEVTIVYRRSEGEMPASREEFLSTRKDGVGFRFLRQPEAWRPGELTLRIMRLGDPDGSGRPRPLPTAVVESMPADTVISAVGAEADVAALAAIGLGDPVVADPATQETSVDGVYLVGDAASGASTIVEAIASSRRAADAITAREGGVRFAARPTPADWLHEPRRLRDRLIPASGPDASDDETGQVEARRCLACSVMCLKCVEVCPNRANTAIRAGGRDAVQILHLDALCNECGNCATFCPWEGKPYRDKMTVFSREDDMSRSENPGFFLRGGRGLLRLGTRVTPLGVENGSVSAEAPEGVKALVAAVARDHAYLLGPV
jgi:putative selenate reductase